MARSPAQLSKMKAAFLPKASIDIRTRAIVDAAAERFISKKGLRLWSSNAGPAGLRKLIGELYQEHRALGGRRRMPSLEKLDGAQLKQAARKIGLINQVLRGERQAGGRAFPNRAAARSWLYQQEKQTPAIVPLRKKARRA